MFLNLSRYSRFRSQQKRLPMSEIDFDFIATKAFGAKQIPENGSFAAQLSYWEASRLLSKSESLI
jgi:hypothetical protein